MLAAVSAAQGLSSQPSRDSANDESSLHQKQQATGVLEQREAAKAGVVRGSEGSARTNSSEASAAGSLENGENLSEPLQGLKEDAGGTVAIWSG